MTGTTLRMLAIALVGVAAGAVGAQTAPLPVMVVRTAIDSGPVQNEAPAGGEALVRSEEVRVPHAPWLRLNLDGTVLAGEPTVGPSSYLLITSLKDGSRQHLDARSLAEWSGTSAYFNGDAVLVELYAFPGTGPSRLSIPEVSAGVSGIGPVPEVNEGICGTDDRVPSNEPANARLLIEVGGEIGWGTAWLITKGECGNRFLTAGHALTIFTTAAAVQFNVPDSDPDGSLNHPSPDDQYAVIMGSIQREWFGVPGSDSAQFFTAANSNTGLSAREGQAGAAYILASSAPPAGNQTVRATGYGWTRYTSLPLKWNQVQKTSTGPYVGHSSNSIDFKADVTPGNSGGPVVLEATGEAIGIVTNEACATSYGANIGTTIEQATLQSFLNNPIGPCDPYTSNFPFVLFYEPIKLWQPEPDPVIVDLQIIPGLQQVVPGSAMVHFRYSPVGTPFMTVPLKHTGGFNYEATLPPAACGDTPQMYFSAVGDGGAVVTKPAHAPEDVYTAQVGTLRSLTTPLVDFNGALPPGWTMSGLWHLAPALACGQSTACEGSGFAYYGVQASCTYNTGGPHSGSVMSPSLPLPLPQAGGVLELEYCSWLQSIPTLDTAQVLVNGALVDTAAQFPFWTMRTVNLDAFAGQSITLEFRFSTAGAMPGGNPRGWQIDGIQIRRTRTTCETCYADCSGNGVLTVADFGCFQTRFVAGDPYADCNGDGVLTVADFACFQTRFVTGCP